MARDTSGPKNEPQYSATGAPADAADLTELGAYAALVGNNKVLTQGQRTALAGADRWVGLTVYETDTGLSYIYKAGGWTRVPMLVDYSGVFPSNLTLGTTAATVPGLALTKAPTGVPCILDLQVDAVNGASGASRWIYLQLFNGATAVDVERRYALPLIVNTDNRYTVNLTFPVTPTATGYTLNVKADQASSVILTAANLRLTVAP